jgi:hypothetical protein
MAMKKTVKKSAKPKKSNKSNAAEAFVYAYESKKSNSPSASTRTKSSVNRFVKEDAKRDREKSIAKRAAKKY